MPIKRVLVITPRRVDEQLLRLPWPLSVLLQRVQRLQLARYAQRCLADARSRDEVPHAAFCSSAQTASVCAVYCDKGITQDMAGMMARRPYYCTPLDFRWIETPIERRRAVCSCLQALCERGLGVCRQCDALTGHHESEAT